MWSQPAPAAPSLPSGTTLTFILDDTLSNPNPRPGTTLRVHLRDALTVGSLTAAAAGSTDRIRISTAVPNVAVAAPQFTISIAPLSLGAAGRLPLAPATPVTPLADLVTGTAIVVKTEATLTNTNGRLAMHIPVPFALTNDAPFADWTPIPMRTAPTGQSSARPGTGRGGTAGGGRRGFPRPSSSPSAGPSPSASPAATPSSLSPSPAPATASPFSPTPGPSPTGVSQ